MSELFFKFQKRHKTVIVIHFLKDNLLISRDATIRRTCSEPRSDVMCNLFAFFETPFVR